MDIYSEVPIPVINKIKKTKKKSEVFDSVVNQVLEDVPVSMKDAVIEKVKPKSQAKTVKTPEELTQYRKEQATRMREARRAKIELRKAEETDTKSKQELAKQKQLEASVRDELLKHCIAKGIEAKVHYPIPIYRQQALAGISGDLIFPVSDRLAANSISFPCDQHLEIDRYLN
jgi:hypothetical protein